MSALHIEECGWRCRRAARAWPGARCGSRCTEAGARQPGPLRRSDPPGGCRKKSRLLCCDAAIVVHLVPRRSPVTEARCPGGICGWAGRRLGGRSRRSPGASRGRRAPRLLPYRPLFRGTPRRTVGRPVGRCQEESRKSLGPAKDVLRRICSRVTAPSPKRSGAALGDA